MKTILATLFFFVCSAQITSAQNNCNAEFGYTIQTGNVYFYPLDSATTMQQHYWQFGDGSSQQEFSIFSSISHVYNPGTYVVTHIVYDSAQNCRDTAIQTIVINYTPACTSTFSVLRDSFQYNRIRFSPVYNIVGGFLNSVSWTLNGTVIQTATGLLDTVLPVGTYNVCMLVTSSLGCSSTYCDTIVIQQPTACSLQANFTAAVVGTNTQSISFSPQPSGGGYRYLWNFGDGGSSIQPSPINNYANAGTYNVRLIIVDTLTYCADTIVKPIQVLPFQPDTCSIRFNYTTSATGITQFFASSAQTNSSFQWVIDSSIIFNIANPVYTFADSGYHLVCLSVVTSTGCVAQVCDSILVGSMISGRLSTNLPAYPNPVIGSQDARININLPADTRVNIRVYNRLGMPVLSREQNLLRGNNVINIATGQLDAGQYFVEILYDRQRNKSTFIKL